MIKHYNGYQNLPKFLNPFCEIKFLFLIVTEMTTLQSLPEKTIGVSCF